VALSLTRHFAHTRWEMAGRLPLASLTLAVVTALLGASSASALDPQAFADVSSGVVLVKASCRGGISQGSGFLVGNAVVMTARHVVDRCHAIRVLVKRKKWVYATNWTNWWDGKTPLDVTTLKLDQPLDHVWVFSLRPSQVPLRGYIAALGYPLGEAVSYTNGRVLYRTHDHLLLRVLSAQGYSGGPIVDSAGRIVGLVNRGIFGRDPGFLTGAYTGDNIVAYDFSSHWGRWRRTLCHDYPKGGIENCGARPAPTTPSTPTPPPSTTPPPPPPPPAPPPAPALAGIWTSLENSSDPAKKIFHIGDFVQSVRVYTIVRFNEALTSSDARAVSFSVVEPDGTTYEGGQFTLDPGFDGYAIPIDVHGSGGRAPMGGTWIFRVEYGAQTLTTGLGFSNFGPFAVATAPSDTFDPHFAVIQVSWRLIQDVPIANNYIAELLSPSGRLVASQVLTTAFASQGTAPLTISCSDAGPASCEYGKWMVRIRLGSNLIWGTTLNAVSPS
jgi:hypothetical protein